MSEQPVPIARRTVTLPVLPLAIVGAVIVAILFLGGGIAVGLAIGAHDGRGGNMQQFRPGIQQGPGTQNGNGFGSGQNGTGQNGNR